MRTFWDRYGFFCMVGLCVAVIAGSGLWAGRARRAEPTVEAAVSANDPAPRALTKPVGGAIVFGYAEVVWLDALMAFGAHEAADFACEAGEAVLAPADGMVRAVSKDALWGVTVTLDHGEGLLTHAAGLATARVAPGGTVRAGEAIGTAGIPAIEGGAPHVHFAVEERGVPRDPAVYFQSPPDAGE